MNTETIQIPAILGGPPAVTLDHESSNKWPNLSHLDEESVLQIMRDGNISTHPVIRELEREYADFTGQKYALAHNNGTSALLAAFYSIGLQPGDEVLVPSATFWASVLPMTWIGAVPVFCESEKERMGIDPVDMERKITDRTKAIVIVHLWGLPSKMTEIFALAEKFNLRIVEDASHAHGATWRGRPCGALGDVSVFSMQGDKLAPAGEGGVFLCNDYEYYEKAICLGDITRIIELQTPARRFAATSFGMKTRIAPISAAIGLNQFRHLKEHNTIRNKNLMYLSTKLEALGFHTFLPPD
ncbi:MAG: aminotransferase class I/II-fold pyridoxal phosphate-dependent enzyme, partial [Desulfobulbales bacterium]